MIYYYEFFRDSFGWPAILALGFFFLTSLSLNLLSQQRKDDLALWLMGGTTEQDWSKSFTAMFDALFGENHLSRRCLVRSCIASLASVGTIWGLMSWTGHLNRTGLGDMSIYTAIAIGIAVNLIADYISLLETRYLLGKLHAVRSSLLQTAVLLFDFLVTGAIILLTIWAVKRSGLLVDDERSWLAVGLAFSIYSAPFYSTFLTSFWTWLYILSTWILRLFNRLNLGENLDVVTRPTLILSLVLSLVVFLASFAASLALDENPETGLSPLDAFVCETFKGDICLRMITVADSDETKFLLQTRACEGGAGMETCQARALEQYEVTPDRAEILWRASCAGGHAASCTNLGFLYRNGIGVAQDYGRAHALYGQGCDGGNARGCTNLGVLYEKGVGVAQDYGRAHAFYGQGCDGGNAGGCTNLGVLYGKGLGVAQDYGRAHALFGQGCDGGNALGCSNLGVLYQNGKGVEKDPVRATELYRQACTGDHAPGCYYLGWNTRDGIGVAPDLGAALIHLRRGCELGNQDSCAVAEALEAAD